VWRFSKKMELRGDTKESSLWTTFDPGRQAGKAEIQSAKDMCLALVSHELRTRLTRSSLDPMIKDGCADESTLAHA